MAARLVSLTMFASSHVLTRFGRHVGPVNGAAENLKGPVESKVPSSDRVMSIMEKRKTNVRFARNA